MKLLRGSDLGDNGNVCDTYHPSSIALPKSVSSSQKFLAFGVLLVKLEVFLLNLSRFRIYGKISVFGNERDFHLYDITRKIKYNLEEWAGRKWEMEPLLDSKSRKEIHCEICAWWPIIRYNGHPFPPFFRLV